MEVDQLKKFKRVFRLLQKESGSRISREGMPNGFLLNGLLWFGDSASEQTALARGFIIIPGERDALDEDAQIDLVDRLRMLLATLGNEYQLQVKLLVCSDYSLELSQYQKVTEAIEDKYQHRWQVWNRTERHTRYLQAMQKGDLRREILVVYFTKVIDSEPRFSVSEQSMADHFNRLAKHESESFLKTYGDVLGTIFPDCIVRAMTDREHFLHYYRFLNPSVGASVPENVFDGYDESFSIQENCLFGDVVQPRAPGISFQLDGYNHAMLVMRELPHRIGPGMIGRLTNLGFQDIELTLNLYPQKLGKVIKQLGQIANQLAGEVKTQPKEVHSLGTQLQMAAERIHALEKGHIQPFKVFAALRLWHRDIDTLISRASIARSQFLTMAGSTCHYATNPETARQLWYQTFPGWTFSPYRGYDLDCDDQTAAELVPWSASFTGRLEGAEALYDSPTGSLVGVATQVGGVPQHILIFGLVGSGKSIYLTDLWAQIAHNFSYILVVEEGNSHGTTVQTAGVQPIIVQAGGTLTINYLDPNGIPLTNEHLGSAVALCLQMLRENIGNNVDQSRLSSLQGVLSQHINLLYDTAWLEWSRKNPEQATEVARRAYQIERHRAQMPGQGNTFLDAWVDVRDQQIELADVDEEEVAKFATRFATRSIVRDLGLSYLKPDEMPTHGQLVELMTLTPIGGYDENLDAVKIGDRLSVWRANGPYGKLFDGVTTSRLDTSVVHFELGLISDSMEELRAAAHFLVLNYARQAVIKRPRAERKFIILEEGARIIQMPGGMKMLSEFYGQMRKFGAVVCTVFQQIAALEAAEASVRAAVLDNTKLFFVSAQPSPRAAEAIGKALDLSDAAVQTIKRYAMPEHQGEGKKFGSFLMVAPDPRRKLVGTLRNVACREVVYCGASDNKTFDERQKALMKYDDVVTAILTEARK